jgi:predicted nicotinamide N-methyase
MPLWDAAISLSKYLQKLPPEMFKGKKVIELGAGCGLPGITAAILGADVFITDQANFVPLIKKNIDDNLTDDEKKVCNILIL